MKIYTITCHDVYNSGASLQAFALQKYLTNLGHDVKIIDYKPKYLYDYCLWGRVSDKYNKPLLCTAYCIAKLPGRVTKYFSKRKRNFDVFRKQYLRLTEQRFCDNDELAHLQPKADVYFVGSDQVWNTSFNNGRDPAFYLSFSPDCAIKASYAASFATQNIVSEFQDFVKSKLQRLNYISVRESSGVEILYSLGLEGINVVDPVFLIDTDEWEKFIEPKNIEPYIFVYAFDGGFDMREFTNQLAEKTHLKIYTLQKLEYGDKCFPNSGPLEFLNLIYNAEYVISNSFHATAFSVIFHKQFWVFNRAAAINTRMRDLTQMLGIEDRLVRKEKNCDTDLQIDYSAVDNALEMYIEKSKKYIDMVLEDGK